MLAAVNDVNKALIDWHSMFMGVALLASAQIGRAHV